MNLGALGSVGCSGCEVMPIWTFPFIDMGWVQQAASLPLGGFSCAFYCVQSMMVENRRFGGDALPTKTCAISDLNRSRQ